MRITLLQLQDWDACEEQQMLFVSIFGESAELTPENWQIAIYNGLDVGFFKECLPTQLSSEFYDRVQPIWNDKDTGRITREEALAQRYALIYELVERWASTNFSY